MPSWGIYTGTKTLNDIYYAFILFLTFHLVCNRAIYAYKRSRRMETFEFIVEDNPLR